MGYYFLTFSKKTFHMCGANKFVFGEERKMGSQSEAESLFRKKVRLRKKEKGTSATSVMTSAQD